MNSRLETEYFQPRISELIDQRLIEIKVMLINEVNDRSSSFKRISTDKKDMLRKQCTLNIVRENTPIVVVQKPEVATVGLLEFCKMAFCCSELKPIPEIIQIPKPEPEIDAITYHSGFKNLLQVMKERCLRYLPMAQSFEKQESFEIVRKIEQNKKINFLKYKHISLLGAVEIYLVKNSDGLFTKDFLDLSRSLFEQTNILALKGLCKAFFFSLSPDRQSFVLSFQEILKTVSDNVKITNTDIMGVMLHFSISLAPKAKMPFFSTSFKLVELSVIFFNTDFDDISDKSWPVKANINQFQDFHLQK